MSQESISALFGADLNVVNVGLRSFAESLVDQGVAVSEVDWRPPRVPRLRVTPSGVDIEAANNEAVERIQQARPIRRFGHAALSFTRPVRRSTKSVILPMEL